MDFDRTVDSGPCGKRGSFSLNPPPPFDTLLESCVDRILEMSGRENVTGIFLGGSFALGEGGVDRESDMLRLISDIDLLVAVPSLEIHERLHEMRRELGAACEACDDDVEFVGSIDVGVMLESEFAFMKPSPFVYDLKHHGVVLYGNGCILDAIPDYEAERIGGGEAVILLLNRILSFLGSFDASTGCPAGDRVQLMYEISKVYTDICVAVLCLSGLYTPGYAARCQRMTEAIETDGLALPVPDDMALAIKEWTGFKLSPSARILSDGAGADPVRRMWDDAAGTLFEWWSRCDSFARGDAGAESGSAWLPSRRNAGFSIDNLRAWRRLVADWGTWRKVSLALGLGPELLSNNPIGLVHERGVRLLEQYVRTGSGEPVDPPAAAYPYPGGSWERAARDINGAWRDIVYGTGGR